MSFIDQVIGDFAATARSSSLSSRIIGHFARTLRKTRLLFGDPLVDFEWCGQTIRLPLSHELPRFSKAFPAYNISLGRLAAVVTRSLRRPIVAVDVGANIGDTAIMLQRNGANTVICVEGSPRFAKLLRQNTARMPEIKSTECLVAFADAPENMSIAEAQGTAHIVESTQSTPVPVNTLDRIMALHGHNVRSIDLLKIDTDGYDGAIIRRHRALLATAKPIIYFEYLFSAFGGLSSATNLPDEKAWETLQAAGYDRFIAFRNTGEPQAYLQLDNAAQKLRELYASDCLGVYADIAAFPGCKNAIADAAATEFGLKPEPA